MIYFDNAATTAIKPKEVGESVSKVLVSGLYGNPGRDSSEFSVNSGVIVNQTRDKLVKLFNVPSNDLVTFTTNVTESLNTVLKGILKEGDHIITTDYEHNSVLRPLAQLKKNRNVDVDYVTFDKESGLLCVEDFEKYLKPNTKAVVCNNASNVTGYVLPIKKISEFCQKHNLLLIVDAAQTAGVEDIDIQRDKIDVLCFTGHKSLYGPQGIGGICFRKPIPVEPLKSGGTGIDSFNTSMPEFFPTRLEAGTMNVPGIVGLSAGIDYLNKKGISNIKNYINGLVSRIMKTLQQYPEIRIYTPLNAEITGTVGFNIGDIDSAEVSQWLWDNYQIATRPGAHCAPRVHERYGTVEQGIVRISLSSFNTDEEVDTFLKAIKEFMDIYRRGL
ncbi:cysteine desulfurase [Companilactobacillus tucceti DSM 20183]|uniref:cysteine desulfurase n=1 Tax=Companilactobacillus tucceti DSM 20183 TaxID=1423811 RepID=A0A0R1J9W2_9LACO|nr:aminotransferase class V-fold PLP-dependent enzyme [Companilactobacillus tucceti]KRK65012.1 cysteine desulfurase [Companilactobacillus tucceti DSM 20183]